MPTAFANFTLRYSAQQTYFYEIQKPFRYENKYSLSQVIIAFINSACIGDSECAIK